MRSAVLIYNSDAGPQSEAEKNRLFANVVGKLQGLGWSLQVYKKDGDNSTRSLTKRVIREGHKLIIAAGGDGTISKVAKCLINTNCTLGILPLGTWNNIARSLGIPLSIDDAVQTLGRFQTKGVDVGVANDKHYFFEAAGVGLDAPLFPLGAKLKKGSWITPAEMWNALKQLYQYRPSRLHFKFDRAVKDAYQHSIRFKNTSRARKYRQKGRRHECTIHAFQVIIANGPYYGRNFTIAPTAKVDDGLFTINVFRRFSKLEYLLHFKSISGGHRTFNPKIDTFVASEITIDCSSRTFPFHIDGKPIGNLPLNLKIVPKALTIVC